MFGQNVWLIILIKAHSLEIYSHGAATPQNLVIPTGIVNHLEIIDRDGLYSLIATWAKSIPYISTDVIWLLSQDVYFEQTFPDAEKDSWDTATVSMLDTVPFEETLSKVYDLAGGRTVIATNQDLISAYTQGFAMQGYATHSVTPAKFQNVTVLDGDTIKRILSNVTQLSRDSLVNPDLDKKSYAKTEPAGDKSSQSVKPKSSLPLLLAVFLVLLAILALVIYLS